MTVMGLPNDVMIADVIYG